MRYLENITIEHAIAHHLDHLLPEKIISHRQLKLTDALTLYLTEHIKAVSRLGSLIPARFKTEGSVVGEACRAILSGEGKFTPQSARIADRLFEAMGTNRSFSPGLLIVAQVLDHDTRRRFVALLKMEAQPVFKEERKTGSDGEVYIELAIDPVALPAPGRNLQKCALIKSEHSHSQPEILLADKQAREAAVAGFFHEHFLEAEYCRDSHFRTKRFVNEFVKWANKTRSEHRLTPEELGKTVGSARKAMRNEAISVPELVQSAISNRGIQSECLEALAKRNVDVQFEIEPKASERFCKVQLIKLDNNVQIRMPLAALLDTEFFTVNPDPDDETVSVITIRSRKYQLA